MEEFGYLIAVVLFGVVGGGHHDASTETQVRNRERLRRAENLINAESTECAATSDLTRDGSGWYAGTSAEPRLINKGARVCVINQRVVNTDHCRFASASGFSPGPAD